MPFYHAYLDESGTDDGSDVLCVAGYLVRSDKARRMARDWSTMLTKFDLPFFHMADCASDPGFGHFAKLSKEQRIAVVTECISITKRHVQFGLAAVVNPKLYRKEAVVGAPDPYSFCLHAVFRGLTTNPDARNEKVELFFERGHACASAANRYFDEVELPSSYVSHEFADKGKVRLLEAADLLAWQMAKHLKDKVFSTRKPRKDFVSLLTGKGHMLFWYDMANAALACDFNPIQPNERRDQQQKAYFTNDESTLREHQRNFRYRAFLDNEPGPVDHSKPMTWFDYRPPFRPTKPRMGLE